MRTWAEIPRRQRAAYRPCPDCAQPMAKHAAKCKRCSNLIRGEAHYAWKGDAARAETKRERAQKMFELGPCERCGKQATDRHHIDGNPGNNVRTNIAILCRRCHMEVDGRLAQFLSHNDRKRRAAA